MDFIKINFRNVYMFLFSFLGINITTFIFVYNSKKNFDKKYFVG